MCGESWVQIHHIDGDPSNNSESNLIPLCRNHAGMVHMSPPPSAGVQAITPSQLVRYREDWIASCSSINPTFFSGIEELRAKLVKLEGEVRRIRQTDGGEVHD